ncbi:hypothetical protein Tco_0328351 [Tanacetum coccineum]
MFSLTTITSDLLPSKEIKYVQDGRVTVQQVQGRQGEGTWLDSVLSQKEEGMQHGFSKSFLTDDLDAYDSNCDDISSAKAESSYMAISQSLHDEITDVQTVFTQMESSGGTLLVDRNVVKFNTAGNFLIKNDRLLDKIISQEIVNIVLNSSVIICDSEKKNEDSVDTCNKCLELEAELVKKNDVYIELLKWFSNLEQHCISLEVAVQQQREIFKRQNQGIIN